MEIFFALRRTKYNYAPGHATPIVLKNTSCENTVGAIALDVVTYSLYTACVAGGFIIYPNVPMPVRLMVWFLAVMFLGVLGCRLF